MKISINSVDYTLNDERLTAFDFFKKPSSNVDIFAISQSGTQIYVQFNDGAGYLYDNIDPTTVRDLKAAERPGSYIAGNIVRKFPAMKIGTKLVTINDRPYVLVKEDVNNSKRKLVARKHDRVYLVSDNGAALIVENIKTGERFPIAREKVLFPSGDTLTEDFL